MFSRLTLTRAASGGVQRLWCAVRAAPQLTGPRPPPWAAAWPGAEREVGALVPLRGTWIPPTGLRPRTKGPASRCPLLRVGAQLECRRSVDVRVPSGLIGVRASVTPPAPLPLQRGCRPRSGAVAGRGSQPRSSEYRVTLPCSAPSVKVCLLACHQRGLHTSQADLHGDLTRAPEH